MDALRQPVRHRSGTVGFPRNIAYSLARSLTTLQRRRWRPGTAVTLAADRRFTAAGNLVPRPFARRHGAAHSRYGLLEAPHDRRGRPLVETRSTRNSIEARCRNVGPNPVAHNSQLRGSEAHVSSFRSPPPRERSSWRGVGRRRRPAARFSRSRRRQTLIQTTATATAIKTLGWRRCPPRQAFVPRQQPDQAAIQAHHRVDRASNPLADGLDHGKSPAPAAPARVDMQQPSRASDATRWRA